MSKLTIAFVLLGAWLPLHAADIYWAVEPAWADGPRWRSAMETALKERHDNTVETIHYPMNEPESVTGPVIALGPSNALADLRARVPASHPVLSIAWWGIPTAAPEGITWVHLPSRATWDILQMQELFSASRIFIARDPACPEDAGLKLRDELAGAFPSITFIDLPLKNGIAAALEQVGYDAAAVYLPALPSMAVNDFNTFVRRLHTRRIPTFSAYGEEGVRGGAVAGSALGVEEALISAMADAIIDGFNDRLFPSYEAEVVDRLRVNIASAEMARFQPDFALRAVAEGYPLPFNSALESLPLADAYTSALRQLPEYQATLEETRISRLRWEQSAAPLLPQVTALYAFQQNDDTRPEVVDGDEPEAQATLGLEITQSLYEEAKWTHMRRQKHVQRRTQFLEEAAALDTMEAVGLAYFAYVEAMTRREAASRHLARVRERRAHAHLNAKDDVITHADRWDVEWHTAVHELLRAHSERERTRLALNRAMGSPLDREYIVEPPPAGFAFLPDEMPTHISHEADWKIFASYVRSWALTHAPELRAMDAALDGARTERAGSQVNFFAPTVRGRFSVEDELGSRYVDGQVSERDDVEWTLRLEAAFPLFRGGGSLARFRIAESELARLQNIREALRQAIDQRARQAVVYLELSMPGMDLSQKAKAASERHLARIDQLADDKQIPLAEHIDALRALRDAEFHAASASAQHHADTIRLERALAWFAKTRTRA